MKKLMMILAIAIGASTAIPAAASVKQILLATSAIAGTGLVLCIAISQYKHNQWVKEINAEFDSLISKAQSSESLDIAQYNVNVLYRSLCLFLLTNLQSLSAEEMGAFCTKVDTAAAQLAVRWNVSVDVLKMLPAWVKEFSHDCIIKDGDTGELIAFDRECRLQN